MLQSDLTAVWSLFPRACTWGVPWKMRAAARMPSRFAGLCRGASSAASSIWRSTSASTSRGLEIPLPCTCKSRLAKREA